MKQEPCKILGGNDNFVARGITDDELVDNMLAHLSKAHPEILQYLTRGEIEEQIRAHIQHI